MLLYTGFLVHCIFSGLLTIKFHDYLKYAQVSLFPHELTWAVGEIFKCENLCPPRSVKCLDCVCVCKCAHACAFSFLKKPLLFSCWPSLML